MKAYRFFYHFNKKEKKMTVHYRGKCMIAKDIGCFADVFTKYNKKQPYLVMQGWASKVIHSVNSDTIIIYE